MSEEKKVSEKKFNDIFYAGIQFAEQIQEKEMLYIYKENLRGLVSPKGFIVPPSELAMSVGVAGGEIQAIGVTPNGRESCVAVKARNGETIVTCALPRELLTPELIKELSTFSSFSKLKETELEM